MRSDHLSDELPALRRYARAVTGTQADGDECVAKMVEHLIINDLSLIESRLDLLVVLDRILVSHVSTGEAETNVDKSLARLSSVPRRALLLSTIEGLNRSAIAKVLDIDEDSVDAALATAESQLKAALATRVLVIEDETMVAMDIIDIVEDLGHVCAGHATTLTEAIALSQGQVFDLVLADIQLADGSSGIDAVEAIRRDRRVEVIFITAFPDRLMSGEAREPAFLIPKPFKRNYVKAMISQALLMRAAA